MITRRILKGQCIRANLTSKKVSVFVSFLALATTCESFRGFATAPTTSFSFEMSSSLLHGANTNILSANVTTPSTTWSGDTEQRQKALERCIIPLSSSSYKGSSGRIGVLGGSERYTGAPYYAAMASLKCGADLAFCFCAEEAAIPLKSYSPELMVAPVYNAAAFETALRNKRSDDDYEVKKLVDGMVEEVCSMMDKMHALVLGPGLGRSPLVLEATAQIIQRAQREHQLPLVVDADALFLLTLPKYQTLLTDESLVVLTPNAMELRRLKESSCNLPVRCIVIEKGVADIIRPVSTDSQRFPIVCGETGGLKRSGGIGDILAGTCGTLVAWNRILTARGKASYDDVPIACWTACCFVKRATKKAYDIHRRSMTAPDILHELGPIIDEMTFDDC